MEPTETSRGLKNPAIPYIAPFALYLAFMPLHRWIPLEWLLPVRFVVVLAVLVFVSRNVISLRVSQFWGSILLGVAVFVIWVGPDILWPAYRSHWLFRNAITGEAKSSIRGSVEMSAMLTAFRVMSSVIIVPILEELFWRGWLMRWLVHYDFHKVRLGTYTAQSFWIVAVLFASEHGPYWDVGLVAGIVYNSWMVRTRSLGDCILAHAVTNGCLAVYVLAAGQWQYWL